MKKFSDNWVDGKVQSLIIVGSMYFLTALTIDFRTSLYPNHYQTANVFYSYIIRIISCTSLCIALVLILRHLPDYLQHLSKIICHENPWIYWSSRIVFVALYLKVSLNMLYPYSSDHTELYFILWFVFNTMIVLPMIIVISKYRG